MYQQITLNLGRSLFAVWRFPCVKNSFVFLFPPLFVFVQQDLPPLRTWLLSLKSVKYNAVEVLVSKLWFEYKTSSQGATPHSIILDWNATSSQRRGELVPLRFCQCVPSPSKWFFEMTRQKPKWISTPTAIQWWRRAYLHDAPASFDAADGKVEMNESLSVIRECCVCQTPLCNLCQICEHAW